MTITNGIFLSFLCGNQREKRGRDGQRCNKERKARTVTTVLHFLVGLWLVCFCQSLWALDAASLLNARLARIHTLQANFTQTITDSRGQRVSQSYGKLALRRPGQFRWEVLRPDPELVIANGKTLSVYEPDLEQLVIRSLTDSVSEAPALLLSRTDISSGDHFHVSRVEGAEASFHLVPKNKDSLFASFRLDFKEDGIESMQIVDHIDQVTTIIFQQEKCNLPLSPALFEFKPPHGTDVIHDKNA